VASEAVAWRARGAGVAAVTRSAGSGGELAWSEQRWLGALSHAGRSGDARAVSNRRGRNCSTGPGPIQCTILFCNYSNFAQISKYKMKVIPMSKIIETWHVARVDPS
jgi:hypothetical protein